MVGLSKRRKGAAYAAPEERSELGAAQFLRDGRAAFVEGRRAGLDHQLDGLSAAPPSLSSAPHRATSGSAGGRAVAAASTSPSRSTTGNTAGAVSHLRTFLTCYLRGRNDPATMAGLIWGLRSRNIQEPVAVGVLLVPAVGVAEQPPEHFIRHMVDGKVDHGLLKVDFVPMIVQLTRLVVDC